MADEIERIERNDFIAQLFIYCTAITKSLARSLRDQRDATRTISTTPPFEEVSSHGLVIITTAMWPIAPDRSGMARRRDTSNGLDMQL